jgi:hypothetical protein
MSPQTSAIIGKLKLAAENASRLGLASEAAGIYRRVLTLIERAYGAQSLEYAEALQDLSEASDDLAVSEQFLRQSADILAQMLTPDDVRLAVVLRSLSDVCHRRGNEFDARRFESEARRLVDRALNEYPAGD